MRKGCASYSASNRICSTQRLRSEESRYHPGGLGSTYGPLKEAVDMLHREKADVNLLHYSEIWPFR